MILSEEVPNQKHLEDVHYLYDNTDDEIRIPLAQLEMLVCNKTLIVFYQDFYQLHQANTGLNKEIEINGKSYKIIDLYGHLDRVNGKLVEIVVSISKIYNFDIPLGLASSNKMNF